MDKYNFEQNLRAHLKSHSYSQSALARKLHVHRTTMNKWITGENQISYEDLYKICKSLALSDEDTAALFQYAGYEGIEPVVAMSADQRRVMLTTSNDQKSTHADIADNVVIDTALTQARVDSLPFEPKTILIPTGSFLMGSTLEAGVKLEETPKHWVELSTYRIGVYSVTNRQYAEFLKREKHVPAPRDFFLREPPKNKLDHPVTNVSWYDAVAYCAWLSKITDRHYRLPTEAEWERAARGAEGRRYPWGNDWKENHCTIATANTLPVDTYPAGATSEGCYDFLGNAQEWTHTLWGEEPQKCSYPYPYRNDDGRENSTADARTQRIHRGGSYRTQEKSVDNALRGASLPTSVVPWRGFRVAMQLEPGTIDKPTITTEQKYATR